MKTIVICLCLTVFLCIQREVHANGNEAPAKDAPAVAVVAASAKDICPLSIGEAVPPLTLQGTDGKAFNLNAAVAKKPTILIFYRGGWCPYCNTQLGQLQTIEPDLLKLGCQILAISPDRPEKMGESVEKGKLTYTLLSDSSMAAAKAFGIAFRVDDATLEKYKGYGLDLEAASGEKHHLLPVPAVFIVGTDGRIKFAYANSDYKVRLAPDALLAEARAALGAAPNPTQGFDHTHALFDNILKTHVVDGMVNYAALKTDSKTLDQYLTMLAAVSETQFKTWNEPRRLAYLVNLYNAATLRLILDHYPLKSIKDIGSLLKGPWDQPVVRLFGKTITLNNLEHDILRKQYNEPRLHMALVCAAKGCPLLRGEAYTVERLNEQLDDQARTYLASPAGLRFERAEGEAHVSSIFKWYGKDFPSVPAFVARHSGQSLDGLKIRYLDYDWTLNEKTWR